MERRKFLGLTLAGAVPLFTGMNSCTPGGDEQSSGIQPAGSRRTLSHLPLEEWREQYRYYLFDDFLPFMEKYVIDHTYGGFQIFTGRDGRHQNTNKRTWRDGRGLWVYSFLYNNLAREQKYLDVAGKTAEFILKNAPEGDEFFYSEFTRDGTPVGKNGTDIYGDMFVACGFAEYAKAAQDTQYWDKAKDLLIKCLRIYDKPDYPYHVTYGPDVAPMKGERVLGHWMLLIDVATQLLKIQPDPEVEQVASRCVDAIQNYHYNSAYDMINEVLNHDLSRPDNDFSQFVYTGHVLEILWMVLFEALRKKDKMLFDWTSQQIKRHFEVAWDDVYGGLFRCLVHVDKNIWEVDKMSWVQEETLIDLLCVMEHTGAQWAIDYFTKLYTYVFDKFPMKQYGYPLWLHGTDRWVTFYEEYYLIENYHHPRHLMLNLTSLDRIMQRNGTVADSFV